jgi:SAM-dependent methyltransferase
MLMRKTFIRLKKLLNQLNLVVRASWYLLLSTSRELTGLEFDLFGRLLGIKYLFMKKRFSALLINPVSSVRYFEFDFVARNIPFRKGLKILDVSSPWLFGFWAVKNQEVDYVYINPDKREFSGIRTFMEIGKGKGIYEFFEQDATELPYPDCIFDVIVSISVIEHISGNGDSRAVTEMWRILKPGGRLILTIPVMCNYEEDYRSENVYSLPDVEQNDGSYFFQRYYDETAITERLLGQLKGCNLEVSELFGEIEKGFFKDYEKRWISGGIKETVKDPWLMTTKMKRYAHLCELPGLGVMGLSLQKIA